MSWKIFEILQKYLVANCNVPLVNCFSVYTDIRGFTLFIVEQNSSISLIIFYANPCASAIIVTNLQFVLDDDALAKLRNKIHFIARLSIQRYLRHQKPAKLYCFCVVRNIQPDFSCHKRLFTKTIVTECVKYFR